MPCFSYDGLPDVARHRETIARILKDHPEPVFLAEKAILIDRYQRLQHCLEEQWPFHLIAYSFKTNYLVSESEVLKHCGAWAEVVSDREYRMARALGYPGNRIVFNGPWKSDACLRLALDEGAIVNVNDHSELGRLIRMVQGDTAVRKVGIRVRSAVSGLGPSRFGFSIDQGEAQTAVARISECPGLQLAGTHCHLPGDTDDPACYREATRNVARFLRSSVPGYQQVIEYVDMGGSYPSSRPQPYTKKTWDPRPIEEYVYAIVSELKPAFRDQQPRLILEPGRYLVGDAFVFLSRVIDRDETNGQQVVLSNASISMLPLTHYSPQAIRVFSPEFVLKTDGETETTLFGASCREDDILFRGDFPAVAVGDLLVHYAVGAYNSSLSPDFIFEAPRAIFF